MESSTEIFRELTPDEVEVSWDRPPRKRGRGRTVQLSKYAQTVKRAEAEAARESRLETLDDGSEVRVGPWAIFPSNKEATVGYEVRGRLIKDYGQHSSYASDNGGNYFQIELRHNKRFPSRTGKSVTVKGVLYARLVIVEGDDK